MNVSVANVALTARPAQILDGVFLADVWVHFYQQNGEKGQV